MTFSAPGARTADSMDRAQVAGDAALGDAPAPRPERRPPTIRTFPGGAFSEEQWSAPDRVTLRVTGEIDAFDRNALIDLLTGCYVEGARQIVIDAGGVGFADISVVRTLVRLATGLERLGASLEIIGLDRIRELLLWLPAERAVLEEP